MEQMIIPAEMTKEQRRAFEIFCEGATPENDYKPTPFLKIESQLKDEGLSGSSSAIQRWSKTFQFKEMLDTQLQLLVINDEDKTIEERALGATVQKRLVDIRRNNELTADCYTIMELFTKQVREDYEKTKKISIHNIKVVKDIAVLTGGREDKLLDRLANQGGEKISSEDLKKEFNEIEIDIED